MGLSEHIRDNWKVFMSAKGAFALLLIFGLATGFGAARLLDAAEVSAANADRDLARNCRVDQSTAKGCPVIHDGRPITVIKTVEKDVPTSDPTQTAKIAELESEIDRLKRNTPVSPRSSGFTGMRLQGGPHTIIEQHCNVVSGTGFANGMETSGGHIDSAGNVVIYGQVPDEQIQKLVEQCNKQFSKSSN